MMEDKSDEYFIWISTLKISLHTLFMMMNVINSNVNIMSYDSGS